MKTRGVHACEGLGPGSSTQEVLCKCSRSKYYLHIFMAVSRGRLAVKQVMNDLGSESRACSLWLLSLRMGGRGDFHVRSASYVPDTGVRMSHIIYAGAKAHHYPAEETFEPRSPKEE